MRPPTISTFGALQQYETKDGSYTLYSEFFNELFHCPSGALEETKNKFIYPAELDRFTQGSKITVLDVCVGLGYNSALLMQELRNRNIKLEWRGLEIDCRPLTIALEEPRFQKNWVPEVIDILKSLRDKDAWDSSGSSGEILWGDARQQLQLLPKNFSADLILLDAFSPNHCPELWTEEFLCALSSRLAPEGRILTYCRAAAIRASLRRSGLTLYSLKAPTDQSYNWSMGTMASLPSKNSNGTQPNNSPRWQSLSLMEEEHLNTRAAVPYRDPKGIDSASRILKRREEEQINCAFKTTSAWQKRWNLGKKR